MSGRRLDNEIPVEKMIKIIKENFGVLIKVSKQLYCTRRALYDYIEVHNLHDVVEEARKQHLDAQVDTSKFVMDELMEKLNDDPALAAKQAHFILSKSKKSPYYQEKDAEVDISISPADLALLSKIKAESHDD